MKIFGAILPLILVSCVTLAPKQLRETSRIVETNVKKDEAYDRALIWFAKNLNNANWAVQIKDKVNGRIVSNIKYTCDNISLTQTALGNRNNIDFTVDVTTKDKKVRIIFENIVYSVWNIRAGETVHGPTDEEDVKEIDEKCLKDIRQDLLNAINGTAHNTRSNDF
ncbi:DUF4468 domain-containing protein [Leptospira dzoumogneensis]|uniref:DUF4468 domain-containing protein n=1 Tax=Leptospira dzoumogneensis TaxID=2484904 RepID=A0A4Z1AFC1_9LEPT|nr:DUF4468 domain-containing protein [Leptospira dzoumogneensis]TGN00317.1 DUF4468 domain-containing protein [Leptospira dzoumogneensis]